MEVPLNPGLQYKLNNGYEFNSTNYAMTKIFGERLAFEITLQNEYLDVIVVRIGYNGLHENYPSQINVDGYKDINDINATYNNVYEWYKSMWLSNIDLFRLFENCVSNNIIDNKSFTIINGVSNNNNSKWIWNNNDIGYQPIYDVYNFEEPKQKVSNKELLNTH